MSRKPVKRAAWAIQSKKERAALVRKYSEIKTDHAALSLYTILGEGLQVKKKFEMLDFLLFNIGETKNSLRKIALRNEWEDMQNGMRDSNKVVEFLKSGLLDEEILARITQEVADALTKKTVPKLVNAAEKSLEKYVRERKLPFVKKVFDGAFLRFMKDEVPHRALLNGRIFPRDFEAFYISALKLHRKKEVSIKTFNNLLLRTSFPRWAITTPRRDAAERWLRKNIASLGREYASRVVFSRSPLGGIFISLSGEELKGFTSFVSERMKRDLQQVFVQKQTARQLPLSGIAAKGPVKKLGSREERKAAYEWSKPTVAEIQDDDALQRIVKHAKNATIAAGLEGKNFDSFEYALQNDPRKDIAQRLRGAVDEGLLHKQQVVRLYSKGDLATRVFFRALDSGFLNSFSKKDIPFLADFICSIGAYKKGIDTVLGGAWADKKKAIFHFLENHKLIGTHHSNGDVVMLRRPQTSR